MRPTWLIEADVYGNEANPLRDEIRRQGMACEMTSFSALRRGLPLQDDACVVGYGTYPFAQQILRHHPWIPGAWCSSDNLDCATYFAHFGSFLLNQEYVILPGVEAIRQADWLFSVFGRAERVFARPARCDKLFVGRCMERSTFPSSLAPTRYDPTTPVVISTPKEIKREWRLMIIDGKIVSGCQYATLGGKDVVPDCPNEVLAFSENVLASVSWRPDPAFMMDVGEAEGRLSLVELNGFSSSWLYRVDLTAVVAAASELAERLWCKSDQRSHPDRL